MEQRNISILVGILLLTGLLIWIDTSTLEYTFPDAETSATAAEPIPWWAALLPWQGGQQRSIKIHEGLDLQGGLQVVLEADPPADQTLTDDAMEAARIVVDNRVNGLGVTEPLVQLQGERRMIVELPGISDPGLAIRTIRGTGLLEFVDAGPVSLPTGTVIQTSFGGARPAASDASAESTPTAAPQAAETATEPEPVYETIITGSDLDEVSNAGLDPNRRIVEINFSLKPEGGQKFGEYTGANIGSHLCMVLDKAVLSCPTVQARIDRQGTISLGNDTLEEGQALAIQLRYGALPVPLKVVENRS
ncbi:MAG: hypothetical protein AB1801_20665, partial [Chloroflexota bacterium]